MTDIMWKYDKHYVENRDSSLNTSVWAYENKLCFYINNPTPSSEESVGLFEINLDSFNDIMEMWLDEHECERHYVLRDDGYDNGELAVVSSYIGERQVCVVEFYVNERYQFEIDMIVWNVLALNWEKERSKKEMSVKDFLKGLPLRFREFIAC